MVKDSKSSSKQVSQKELIKQLKTIDESLQKNTNQLNQLSKEIQGEDCGIPMENYETKMDIRAECNRIR